MSLDITLEDDEEIMRCPACDHSITQKKAVWSGNITHNLVPMAVHIGIYGPVWSPEENGIQRAGDLIRPLNAALVFMAKRKPECEALNPENGWGSYDSLYEVLSELQVECYKNPDATIRIWK